MTVELPPVTSCPWCGGSHEALSCPIPPDDQLAFSDDEEDEHE